MRSRRMLALRDDGVLLTRGAQAQRFTQGRSPGRHKRESGGRAGGIVVYRLGHLRLLWAVLPVVVGRGKNSSFGRRALGEEETRENETPSSNRNLFQPKQKPRNVH